MVRLRENLDGWGLPRRILAADLRKPPFRPGSFDVVLLDAPCSGTGTMAKNPEIRWRLSPARLARHGERQRALVVAAAGLVAPGGRLVWSTCSLEPEENEEVVSRLLEAGGWAAEPLAAPEGVDSVPTGDPVPQGRRILPGAFSDGHSVFRLRRGA